MVDSIDFDATKDDPNFELCRDHIFQYFNDSKGGLLYEGEKSAIKEVFSNKYNKKIVTKETGLVRIPGQTH